MPTIVKKNQFTLSRRLTRVITRRTYQLMLNLINLPISKYLGIELSPSELIYFNTQKIIIFPSF